MTVYMLYFGSLQVAAAHHISAPLSRNRLGRGGRNGLKRFTKVGNVSGGAQLRILSRVSAMRQAASRRGGVPWCGDSLLSGGKGI